MNNIEKIKELGIDLLEKHFPKGECKERGQAMVFFAELLIEFEKILQSSEYDLEKSKTIEKILVKFKTLADSQEDCPPEFLDIINKHFWDLL